MGQIISRRAFLKGGVATAATLAAATIPGAAAVSKPDEGTQLATLLDISKCIGCEACVEACPEDVQAIGPRDEMIKKAHALAKEINGYIYGEKENGGTNTIYVSPVPFEALNETVEKGKGKPHLKPVKDTMAQANNLTTAMVLAPVAGIAAAVGKYYKLAKNGK